MYLKSFKAIALASTVLLSSCHKNQTVAPDPQPVDSFTTYSAEDFFKTTSVFGSSINHDGTAVLVSSDASGIFNVYRVPLDGGDKVALTASTEESMFANSWFPNDDRILFNADEGGNELDHVYVRNLDGTVVDLTHAKA